jgi:SAM-dependent methyltransferase
MTASGFDQFADTYADDLNQALAASGESKDYFAQGRVRWLGVCLTRLRDEQLGSPLSVLDYGCGVGDTTPHFREFLDARTVVGIDISQRSINNAQSRYGSPANRFATFEDYLPEGSMDLVYCNGVFHHIPVLERRKAVDYIYRCLRPGGLFALWENNPWNPGTRYVMAQCVFDHDAIMLSPPEASKLLTCGGFEVVSVTYQFVFPKLLRILRFLEAPLSRLPLGGQYQVLCRKLPA